MGHLTSRGVMVFFLKNILIPNIAEKNILILEGKKKSDSELSGKKILNETKNHNCKLNGRSLKNVFNKY
jgi:hypothetical protein